MQKVVRVLDDFLSELGEVLAANDILKEPEAFSYGSVDEVLETIENANHIFFMFKVYKEEITLLVLSEELEDWQKKKCMELASMIEELEALLGESREKFSFRAYEVYFFIESFLSTLGSSR